MSGPTSRDIRLSLGELAAEIGGEIVGDPAAVMAGAAPFETADEAQITFAEGAFLKKLGETRAGAAIVPRAFAAPESGISLHLLKAENPKLAFAKAVRRFHPPEEIEHFISDRACIGRNLTCGRPAFVDAFVRIGDDVTLGDRVRIHSHVAIGDGVSIGDDTEIHPNATILRGCRIGSRVTVQAGAVIGGDGFGYVQDGPAHYKIPHTGIVRIDDDVEIGANAAIDRGTFGKTHIRRGVKIDNLVHIAHNVTVGEDALIIAQAGVAGSVAIGGRVILAGQAGVSGHLTIADDAVVGPQTGVGKSIRKGEIVSSGLPAMPHRLWLRVQRLIPRLPELTKKISDIEKRLHRLEDSSP